MVLYWKPLTNETNIFIIDVNWDPGLTSVLILFLWIHNSICYEMSVVFFPDEADELHLANKTNYFLQYYC